MHGMQEARSSRESPMSKIKNVVKHKRATAEIDIVTIGPNRAAELLEMNRLNRPINDAHVRRLVAQIAGGHWKFNGDTIKIAEGGDVLDGQHRLWAVVESKCPIETVIVTGVARDAFSTIDTLRKMRTGSDVVALAGQLRLRGVISAALGWLLRWQRGVLVEWRNAENRIENVDIEAAFAAHRDGIVHAAERSATLRGLANRSLMTFLYYITANRNPELADRMINTLDDPAGVATSDPFFRLRAFFTQDHYRAKDPVVVIALAIKAINAAHHGDKLATLTWKNQGSKPEAFPVLKA